MEIKPTRISLKVIVTLICIVWFGNVANGAETTVRVRWVDDGDTIVLADGRRIRYIGIDTPELGNEQRKPQPFGFEAKNLNQELVLQKHVRLEFDKEKFDHYGRYLGYVFDKTDIFINKEMLNHGFAHYLYHYPNIRYHSVLLKAQRFAMKAKKGIWNNWKESEKRYIGNKGSRRFHLDNCPLAQKISFSNRVYFTKKWDALWQGYSPAKKCLPEGILQ